MEFWSDQWGGRINTVGSHYGITRIKHILRMYEYL